MLELGEKEDDFLPYLRPRKLPNESINEHWSKMKPLQIPDSGVLLAASRMTKAFNEGDFEAIVDIIQQVAHTNCFVELHPWRKCSRGTDFLISLWKALFEAFPDGNFRLSDTYVDHNHNAHTKFIFSGVKIFPIKLTAGSIMEGFTNYYTDQMNDISYVQTSKYNPSNRFHQLNPDIFSNCLNGSEIYSNYINHSRGNEEFRDASIPISNNNSAIPNKFPTMTPTFSGINEIVSAFYHSEICSSVARNPVASRHLDTTKKSASYSVGRNNDPFDSAVVFSTVVETEVNRPIFTSRELQKIEKPEEFVTRGVIICHFNEEKLIEKFIFNWDKSCD